MRLRCKLDGCTLRAHSALSCVDSESDSLTVWSSLLETYRHRHFQVSAWAPSTNACGYFCIAEHREGFNVYRFILIATSHPPRGGLGLLGYPASALRSVVQSSRASSSCSGPDIPFPLPEGRMTREFWSARYLYFRTTMKILTILVKVALPRPDTMPGIHSEESFSFIHTCSPSCPMVNIVLSAEIS